MLVKFKPNALQLPKLCRKIWYSRFGQPATTTPGLSCLAEQDWEVNLHRGGWRVNY